MLKTWSNCTLQANFKEIQGLPGKQGSKATWGTCMHAALDHWNRTDDSEEAVRLFTELWDNPASIGCEIDVWNRFTTFGGLRLRGIEIIRSMAEALRWEHRTIIASEHQFLVPFGDHELTGTVDLVELKRNAKGVDLLRICDYKGNGRRPSHVGLALDIQFTTYWYATLQREFWVGNGPDFPGVVNGEWWWETLQDVARRGIWIQLMDNGKEIDAGPRSQDDFDRLYTLCNEVERAINAQVFVPSIGEACLFCLAGETKVVTSNGVAPIEDLAGSEHTLMTDNGRWVSAKIESFGRQRLWRVDLSRGKEGKSIYATAEHRWLVFTDRRVNRTTQELRVGSRLVALLGQGINGLTPSPWGVAHGIVFGDGSRKRDDCSFVDLFGLKRELARYFPLSPGTDYPAVPESGSRPNCLRIDGLPWAWKDRPVLRDRAYLYGWLVGYFATDGCITDSGHVSISSATKAHLELVRNVCYRLGILTHGITSYMRLGTGDVPTPLHKVTLAAWTLNEEFFVRSDQRARFMANADRRASSSSRRMAGWKVEAVTETDRVDEVYCAVVPETHTFLLEDNILTGNCDFANGPCPTRVPTKAEWDAERLESPTAWL